MAFATEENLHITPVSTKFLWHKVPFHVSSHVGALIGLYLSVTNAMLKTILFAILLYVISIIGVTAGAHRLWSHRAYKAKLPLRILLAFFSTVAFQLDIYTWVRDHRLHHKFTETNADPHNVKRGFFFSHMGWLMSEKHPDVTKKENSIDLSDLLSDPVVVFQRKYFPLLATICCFVLPTVLPKALWGESFYNAFFIAVTLRWTCSSHMTYCVNSFAHMWGNRPYTKSNESRENFFVNLVVLGEGFHNYHHTFPWDYAASEFGTYFSLTTAFINLMALLGLAYDLKTVPLEIILERKQKQLREGGNH